MRRVYVKKIGLSVLLMDWKCTYPDNFNLWDDLFAKYGFDYKFYGGNPNFLHPMKVWVAQFHWF